MLVIDLKFSPNCFIIQYADDTILMEKDITNLEDLIKRGDKIFKQVTMYFLKTTYY